jgi:hypothetical protein
MVTRTAPAGHMVAATHPESDRSVCVCPDEPRITGKKKLEKTSPSLRPRAEVLPRALNQLLAAFAADDIGADT